MYKDYISWIDLLLVPIYFIGLYLVMLYIRKKHKNNILYQKYLIKGFVFKIACTILYCLLLYYYWGLGDSINYFKNALYVRQLMREDSENFSIFFQNADYLKDTYNATGTSNESGWLVERIAIILSYVSFSRFIICSMLFATLAYSGMFKMFETFNDIMPGWHKKLAFAVLFFPTLSIYGSGILKDTICISAMGWLIYSSQHLFNNKRINLKYLLIFLLCIFLIYLVKAYVIAAFLIPYILYVIAGLINKVKNRFLRWVFFPMLLGTVVVLYVINAAKIDSLLGNYAIGKLFDTVKEQQQSYFGADVADAGSGFDLGTIDPTISSFVNKIPAGIIATLYRPFLWEVRNFLMLFSALESLLIFGITLFVMFKTGIFRFFRTIFSDRFIFLCIFFALIFAALVGLSTSNFGTLGRYRIPIIPFYFAGIFGIWYRTKINVPKKQHESTG